MGAKLARPLERPCPFFDTSSIGKPDNVNFANFINRPLSRQMAAALRLYPPARYQALARLERDLQLRSPLLAYGVVPATNLFSSRIGCQIYQPLYGIDFAARFACERADEL